MDFEGTTYSSEGGKITAVAYIIYDTKQGEIIEEYCQYINRGQAISKEVLSLTGKNQEFYNDKPRIEDIRPHLENVLSQYKCYFYNAEADIQYLKNEYFFKEKKSDIAMECAKKMRSVKETTFCEKKYNKIIEREKKYYIERFKKYEEVKISDTQFHYFAGTSKGIVRGFFFKMCSIKDGFRGIQRSELELYYEKLSTIMHKIVHNINVTDDEKSLLYEFICKQYMKEHHSEIKKLKIEAKYLKQIEEYEEDHIDYVCVFNEIRLEGVFGERKRNYDDLKLKTVATDLYHYYMQKELAIDAHNPLNDAKMTLLAYLYHMDNKTPREKKKQIINGIFDER